MNQDFCTLFRKQIRIILLVIWFSIFFITHSSSQSAIYSYASFAEKIYLQLDGKVYTEWNKNFGTDFIFKEYIRVFATATTIKPIPIIGITPTENQNEPDLQFFPESGELVHGIPCKVGFKGLDHNGKGISIEGEIVTKEGAVVTFLKSNQLDMRSFILSSVDSASVYYAKVKSAIPAFSAPREFYAPIYENLQPTDWYKPDLRALVHWMPKIYSDHLGKAAATFYNADITGEMMVVVEAISENGEIGYKEMVYEVKKRN